MMTITEFQLFILDRFAQHARDLPWRISSNPYHVLVSEIMSHQTQIGRVIPYFHRWTQRAPQIQDVATLSTSDLLGLRQGLGYNNRALRLRETCAIISDQCNGIVPSDPTVLQTLPGIGLYTSHAIASFAYNLAYPVLDVNIKRVWYHHFPETQTMKDRELIVFAQQYIPDGQSCLRHSALMDYGAVELPMHKSNIRIGAKQSKFAGSTRRVRSHIVKHLLQYGPSQTDVLYTQYAAIWEYDRIQFDDIVQKMIKDQLIILENGLIIITR